MTAAMLGAMPKACAAGGNLRQMLRTRRPLSAAVRQSVGPAIDAILQELQRLGFKFQKKLLPDEPGIWWSDHEYSGAVETLS